MRSSFSALLTLTAAVALTSLSATQIVTADGGDSNKIPKVAGTLQTTPPPVGAEVLFDGTEASLDKWEPGNKDSKVWPIKNGIWVDTATDLFTKKSYGSCQIHLEWRVPANREVNGQSGGNSGVIFMPKKGWYEVQILESHSNPGTYADGIAGSIYQHSAPKVNPSLPKGEWQSYDITFTAPKFGEKGEVLAKPKFTVIYNGVAVQENFELSGTTLRRGSKLSAHPAKQPIMLQWHKDPIEFRNIWIKDLEK
ncbi:MAG: DUF1080 domain-containing protein [Puniceicoccales bacterium]|nr:DUF1080 domain-containing protein [Puniceicoccales bacterium]